MSKSVFTLYKVRQAFRRVLEQNPAGSNTACEYSNYHSPTVPVCVVGHVAFDLGGSDLLGQIRVCGQIGSESGTHARDTFLAAGFTPAALDYLAQAQSVADTPAKGKANTPWVEAYDYVEALQDLSERA